MTDIERNDHSKDRLGLYLPQWLMSGLNISILYEQTKQLANKLMPQGGKWLTEILKIILIISLIFAFVFAFISYTTSLLSGDNLLRIMQSNDLATIVATSLLISVASFGSYNAYSSYQQSVETHKMARQRDIRYEIVEAWNTVTKKFSGGGKLRALEFLAKRGESLDGIDLSKETMGGQVYLGNLDLSEETLGRRVSLNNAKLSDANLINANLICAYLTYADLTGADLTDAKLRYADLALVNFTGAQLNGANLTLADLTCANLTDTEGLTQKQLNKAYYRSVPDSMTHDALKHMKQLAKDVSTDQKVIDKFPHPTLPEGLTIKSMKELERDIKGE